MHAVIKYLLCLVSVPVFVGVSFADSLQLKKPGAKKEVVMNINDAYFLEQKTEGDAIRFVVNGLYPNSCYSFSRFDVEHNSDFKHTVKMVAGVQQGICLMVLTPFTQESSLGVLLPGKHQVVFTAGDGTGMEKSVNVK